MDNWLAAYKGIPVTLSDLPKLSQELCNLGQPYDVWCVVGDMGAGKTTLIKQLARTLGVQDTVASPTFSLVHEYLKSDGGSVYHFDFYRLESETEALEIGVEEYFYSGSTCLIEWSEKIPSLIPDQHFSVRIDVEDDEHRRIYYRGI